MEDIVNRQFSDLMEPELSDNARYIAETRYGMKGEGGERLEKVKDIFKLLEKENPEYIK